MIKKLKKLYPKWIPYPSSWLRAFVLIFILGPTGMLLTALGLWGIFGMLFAGSTGDLPLSGVWLFLAIAALVLFVPTAILAYAYHILTLIFNAKSISAKHPRWFPTKRSWREGLTGVIVMGLSWTIAILFILWYRPDLFGNSGFISQSEKEAIATFATIVWLISAAYLYQWDYWVREKRSRKPKKRKSPAAKISKTSRPAPKLDEIDIELNQLRGEMGINQMKTYPSRKPS